MKLRLAAPLQIDSIVDGEGLRAVVWTQGCPHNCLGCHNPQTHDFKGGFITDTETLKKEIEELKSITGITFSGGDPFIQPAACAELAAFAKKQKLNIWCYTGYLFEDLLKMSKLNKGVLDFLNEIDVLIDGKFMLELRSFDATFRGSSNQRVIDVPKSLKSDKLVLVEKYNMIPKERKEHTGIYI